MTTVTLSLFRFASPAARLWVLGQMALARIDLARTPGAQFWKLCGSGTGEGFTPRPNWSVWAILVAWPDMASARDGLRRAAVFRRWRGHAAEDWSIYLDPVSVRGQWSGRVPFAASAAPPSPIPSPRGGGEAPVPDAPLAVLTRATLRPRAALRFWGRVPDISAAIGTCPDVAFKIGIGEVPLIHQVTFSVWPDAAAMTRFARADGPHARAIRAVREGGWFREELYARFRILGAEGLWGGAAPLTRLPVPPPALDAA
jgi:spheroidene monooxygenase